MANLHSLPIHNIKEFEPLDSVIGFSSKSTVIAMPERGQSAAELHLPDPKPTSIRLAVEELKCFEVVEHQFSRWGLTFHNTIAIQPSNPAFIIRPGVTVLMGSPKSGLLEITFQHPVRFVSGLVTSSRRTVLSAKDPEGHLLAQTEIPSPNLVGSNSPVSPNAPLSVRVPNIHKVTFYAFDGQIIIDNLSFGF